MREILDTILEDFKDQFKPISGEEAEKRKAEGREQFRKDPQELIDWMINALDPGEYPSEGESIIESLSAFINEYGYDVIEEVFESERFSQEVKVRTGALVDSLIEGFLEHIEWRREEVQKELGEEESE